MRAMNRALIESIQSGLGGNEQQFTAFKYISAWFRNGDIGVRKYYSHISKLGLLHLVPRLTKLCLDQNGKKGEEQEIGLTTVGNRKKGISSKNPRN